ncbi:general stress protein [Neobacillus sp. 114]|uniref:general stress protein n=1 Tax=Neobacillus sp. 114 TaxID=3048535 RepID=UPI0024C39704|nr:general stress protein [Neobacillus sp. 114]
MDKHMKNVVGVYDTEQEAIHAIDLLLNQGYHKDEISVIGKNVNHVARDTGTAMEETAAAGAAVGSALGGIPGLLAGAGALAIPGVGPFIAAGPIAAGLMGAAAGAGIGGLTGALVGMGIPDDKAESYENSVKEGKIIVLVEKHIDNRNDRNYLHEDTELDHPPLVGVDGRNRNRKEDGLIKEGPPFPGSSYKFNEFGSNMEEESSLKDDRNTLKKANNSSMAQDYSEMKKLGREMEQQPTEEKLRDEHLKPDPLQSTKKA